MSNHYHLVVNLIPGVANTWSDRDVVMRWCALFKGPLLIQRYAKGESLSAVEMTAVRSILKVYRRRLKNLSWFMRCMNEPIARKANREDQCTGHFWEARFISQALCSDKALLTCMAYVDLNPIRAKMAKIPETSLYTSIKERISQAWDSDTAIASLKENGELSQFEFTIRPLRRFRTGEKEITGKALPITFQHYLELVDTAGRVIHKNKRRFIDQHTAPILKRLQLSEKEWIDHCTQFEQLYRAGKISTTKVA